jgi:hypothetical protein
MLKSSECGYWSVCHDVVTVLLGISARGWMRRVWWKWLARRRSAPAQCGDSLVLTTEPGPSVRTTPWSI